MTRQQRHAVLVREQAVNKAVRTIEAHPRFPDIQVELHELENRVVEQTPFESVACGTEARAQLALALFEIRAEAYLEAVTNLEFQKAHATLVDHFARLAFRDYTGYPIEMLEPLGPTGQGITAALQKRARHWINEGYKRLASSSRDTEKAQESVPESTINDRRKIVDPILNRKGWSVLDWANEANVSHATAMDYLDNKTTPYRSTLLKLAQALGVTVEELPR
jgi:lambda repressor-like predicted transcriptional regulator